MRSHISVRISKGDGGPPRPPVRCGKPERIKPHTAPAKADGAAALGLGARALPEHDLFPILIPKAETGLAERQSRRRFFGSCTVYVHIMYTLCTMLLLEKLIKHTYTHASVLNQAAATELYAHRVRRESPVPNSNRRARATRLSAAHEHRIASTPFRPSGSLTMRVQHRFVRRVEARERLRMPRVECS